MIVSGPTPVMSASLPDARDIVKELTRDAAFPKRPGYPREFAWLTAAIIQNPMLNGQTIRLDGGQRFAPR